MSQHQTNQLAGEKSPYLLQHAQNPVNWFPWSDEAFEKARKEDKPIFLSIGYSTCHWCHVMEHESFEDNSVAELLNKNFVSIKVDREERPDIDSVYMTVCQMMTGSGGWPLTVLITPEKKPFFAATYLPKHSGFGRVGMMDLLPKVTELWGTKRGELEESGQKITQLLSAMSEKENSSKPNDKEIEAALFEASKNLSARFDRAKGGFSKSPKFPTPHNLNFLLRDWKKKGRQDSLEMVKKTLESMRCGGIWDHVGFGFHRYSTDSEWLLPHFEKMLYDQALLALAYTDAFLATGKPEFAQTVREIFEYVERDLTSGLGGFYSAEDADSEGEEGKFYVWTNEEIETILDGNEAELFISTYGFQRDGNFKDESTQRKNGSNIPHLSAPLQSDTVDGKDIEAKLDAIRQKLLKHRSTRVRPSRDEKILTDWNGLMIAAYAKASAALDEPKYLKSAQRAAEFLFDRMKDEDGNLLHRFFDGESAIQGFLDDYAFLAWGCIEIYQACFDERYFERAIWLMDTLIEHFWDEKQGGFFQTDHRLDPVLARQKDAYDGALPSGNSVAAMNLSRLARMTGNHEYEKSAQETIRAFSASILRGPEAFTHLLQALDFITGNTFEVVLVGERDSTETQEMAAKLRQSYLPNTVVLFRSEEKEDSVSKLSPFTHSMVSEKERTTAYVCQGHKCEMPTTELQKMTKMLDISKIDAGEV